MTTQGKKQLYTILGIGALGLAAYYAYKNKKAFAGFVGDKKVSTGTLSGKRAGIDITKLPDCGSDCTDNKCKVAVYDAQGNVSLVAHYCEGTAASQIGGVINPQV